MCTKAQQSMAITGVLLLRALTAVADDGVELSGGGSSRLLRLEDES